MTARPSDRVQAAMTTRLVTAQDTAAMVRRDYFDLQGELNARQSRHALQSGWEEGFGNQRTQLHARLSFVEDAGLSGHTDRPDRHEYDDHYQQVVRVLAFD